MDLFGGFIGGEARGRERCRAEKNSEKVRASTQRNDIWYF